MNLKHLFIIVIALFVSQPALAYLTYTPHNDPSQQMNQANPYQEYNPYSTKNTNNPYSQFQNPYDSKSIYNNSEKYSQKTYSTGGQYQGYITTPKINDANSMTNPYSKSGNVYQPNAINPYNQSNAKYPYGSLNNNFNNPYNNNSIYNSPQYKAQLYDNRGVPMGVLQTGTYNNSGSALNPYGKIGNPYNKQNAGNPY